MPDYAGSVERTKLSKGETDKLGNNSFTLPKSLKICGGESVTWTEDVTYADEIRVCSGSTLTIQSEVGFVPDGKNLLWNVAGN
ncbi:MAG: hypothetical protein R2764_05635 [Bacteroidales bacterium]